MKEIIFIVYIAIGLICSIYDWFTVQKYYYKEAVEENALEPGMVPVYWILWLLVWPILLIMKLFEKNETNSNR